MNEKLVKLQEIAEIHTGHAIPKESSSGKKISFIRISDLQDNQIESTNIKQIKVSSDNFKKLTKKTKVKKNDILISTHATIGKSAIATKDLNAYVTPQITQIRITRKDVLPDYLLHELNSKKIQEILNKLARGAVIRRIPNEAIPELQISLVPLSKQKQIIKKSKTQNLQTESDIRAKINSSLLKSGWTSQNIKAEVAIASGKISSSHSNLKTQRVDYVLNHSNNTIAVVEVKARNKDARDGLQQAKTYAKMLNVQFAYSTNGKEIIEYDFQTKKQTSVKNFPTPLELKKRLRI